jgi:hypothetical protein
MPLAALTAAGWETGKTKNLKNRLKPTGQTEFDQRA